jgi:Leu/Phe-tRNA-protein transferase
MQDPQRKASGRLGSHSAQIPDGTDSDSEKDEAKMELNANLALEWNKSLLRCEETARVQISLFTLQLVWEIQPLKSVPIMQVFWHLPIGPDLDIVVKDAFEALKNSSLDCDEAVVLDTILDEFVRRIEYSPFHFFWAPEFRFTQIAAFARAGFLPMAVKLERKKLLLSLFKLHRKRCIIDLKELEDYRKDPGFSYQAETPTALFYRAARANRGGKSAKYRISVNEDFEGVVYGINTQHGVNSWFFEPLVKEFKHLQGEPVYGVQILSIELWEGIELVAGELGYAVGGSYTSLSGFHVRKGTGTIQMLSLGELLRQRGFLLWDLGMRMKYKLDIGGQIVYREKFLSMFRKARALSQVKLCSSTEPNNFDCSELVGSIRPLVLPSQPTLNSESKSQRKRLLKEQKRAQHKHPNTESKESQDKTI